MRTRSTAREDDRSSRFLLEHALRLVVLADAEVLLDHLGEWPIRDAASGGEAASSTTHGRRRLVLENGPQLADEPGLPDSGVAHHGTRIRRWFAALDGAPVGGEEELDPARGRRTPHAGRRRPAGASASSADDSAATTPFLPLRLDVPARRIRTRPAQPQPCARRRRRSHPGAAACSSRPPPTESPVTNGASPHGPGRRRRRQYWTPMRSRAEARAGAALPARRAARARRDLRARPGRRTPP